MADLAKDNPDQKATINSPSRPAPPTRKKNKTIGDFLREVWKNITRAFRKPSLELVAGGTIGSSTGRVVWWTYLGFIGILIGSTFLAISCFALAVWELWIGYHSFRYLAKLFVYEQFS